LLMKTKGRPSARPVALVAVQPEDSTPIVTALQTGTAGSDPWPDPQTVAFGLTAPKAQVAAFVREVAGRLGLRGANVVSIDSGAGLANATLQQRLVAVRLFCELLMEEGVRESNPVGRGRYTPRGGFGGGRRGWCPGRPGCRGFPVSNSGRTS
jgi:hypothetical protein